MTSQIPVVPRDGWKCFHCGEVLTTYGAARDHFGATPAATPACQIKAGAERGILTALRKAEEELARYREEDQALVRELHSMQSRHSDALRTAEELGYERGLHDNAKRQEMQPIYFAGARGGGKSYLQIETVTKKANARIAQLEAEIEVTDKLYDDCKKALFTVPPCPAHGPGCIPHAVAWIKGCKDRINELEAAIKQHQAATKYSPDHHPLSSCDKDLYAVLKVTLHSFINNVATSKA